MSTSPEGGEGRVSTVVPVFAPGAVPVFPTPVDPGPEFLVGVVVVVVDGDVVVVVALCCVVVVVALCCVVVVVGGIVVVVVVVVVVVLVVVVGIMEVVGVGGGTVIGVMTVSTMPEPQVDTEAELFESPP